MYGGGAIYVHNYNRYGDPDFQLQICNITGNSNRADQGNGGGIYIYNNNLNGHNINFLNVHNTTALSNRANHGNGGGIYIGSSGIINSRTSIIQCQFINNTASQLRKVDEQYLS